MEGGYKGLELSIHDQKDQRQRGVHRCKKDVENARDAGHAFGGDVHEDLEAADGACAPDAGYVHSLQLNDLLAAFLRQTESSSSLRE